MFKTDEDEFFESILFQCIGKQLIIQRINFLSGGYGNNVVRLETAEGNFCVKWKEGEAQNAFTAQADDLYYLVKLGLVNVPKPLGAGKIEDKAFLLTSDIGFHLPNTSFWNTLGEQLATLHAKTSKTFGWRYTNKLHNLEMKNETTEDWPSFFFENRLKPAVGKAYFDGKVDKILLRKIDTLQQKVSPRFSSEPPALLHGNLYSDNIIAGTDGEPFLMSPVPYFGNRELEITRLLFLEDIPKEFLETYQSFFPLKEGYQERQPLYQLYVLVQYLNQFGKSYLSGINRILKAFGVS